MIVPNTIHLGDCLDLMPQIQDNSVDIVLFGAEPFSSKLRLSNLDWYKYDYTWVKTKASGFQNAKKQPMIKHENIMVFYQNQPTFNQQHLIELDKPIESGRKRLRNDEQHRLGVAGKEHKNNTYRVADKRFGIFKSFWCRSSASDNETNRFITLLDKSLHK